MGIPYNGQAPLHHIPVHCIVEYNVCVERLPLLPEKCDLSRLQISGAVVSNQQTTRFLCWKNFVLPRKVVSHGSGLSRQLDFTVSFENVSKMDNGFCSKELHIGINGLSYLS